MENKINDIKRLHLIKDKFNLYSIFSEGIDHFSKIEKQFCVLRIG